MCCTRKPLRVLNKKAQYHKMFDHSNWKKHAMYSQRLARWLDKRRKNIWMQCIRRTLDKYGLHVEASCRIPLLLKFTWIDLWSSGRMFYRVIWPNGNFLELWISGMSGVIKEEHHLYSQHGGGPVLLWGCFTVAGSGNHEWMKDIINSLKY